MTARFYECIAIVYQYGFDKLDKKVQQAMMAQMGPIFIVQFLVTVMTSLTMVFFENIFPGYSLYLLMLWVWLGFVVPAQVGGVLFGGALGVVQRLWPHFVGHSRKRSAY